MMLCLRKSPRKQAMRVTWTRRVKSPRTMTDKTALQLVINKMALIRLKSVMRMETTRCKRIRIRIKTKMRNKTVSQTRRTIQTWP